MDTTQDFIEAEDPQKFAKRVGLTDMDTLLLNRALTHRSFLNEHPEAIEDNERLEFLGDAVLDFLVGAWLYHRFPEMAEGALTRLRSAIVRTESLADFALEIELNRAMRLGRGEAESGGRDRPALLCATFEALIGAIFLDGDIQAVREFLDPLLESVADTILANGHISDPKSQLQEWAQARGGNAPTYHTISAIGPDHAKIFEIEVHLNGKSYGKGRGHSKQAAAKEAAKQALRELGLA